MAESLRSARRCGTPGGGFSLIELMIVVAIVAILAAIAYPAYTSQVVESRRADGKAKLLEVMQAQERAYTTSSTYETDLTNLGYSASSAPSDEGWYVISAASCGSGIAECVALTATPQGAQASNDTECANLTINSRGVKGISGTGTVAECW